MPGSFPSLNPKSSNHRSADDIRISVPHLVELKNACAPQIATYRACLDRHASQDDAVIEGKCGGLMKEVWKCSERVMGDIERGHGAGARGGDGERLV